MTPGKIISGFVMTIVSVIVISLMFGSFYTVDEGERAVIVTQGKITSVQGPGMHWKTPFIVDAHKISTRTQAMEFDKEPVYTADRQTADVTFSVNYSIIPTDTEVASVYRNFQTLEGLESRVIKRQVKEQIKNIFGTFTADTAIRERGRLNNEIQTAIANIGDGLIKVEGINIENIDFSDAVEEAAEGRAQAGMQVQTEKQKLEREKILADQAIEQARGRAQSQLAEAEASAQGALAQAKATAEGNRLIGEAEAASIKAKSEALSANPSLIEYQKALKWSGNFPTTMVPNATLPFMQIK